MRLQEIILKEAGDVIDAAHRFRQAGRTLPGNTGKVLGTDKFGAFNKDTDTHGMIKRHIQIGIDSLYMELQKRSSDVRIQIKDLDVNIFAAYFKKRHMHTINRDINDISFRNVGWVEITGVDFSPEMDEMELALVVQLKDPSNTDVSWLRDIKTYLYAEAIAVLREVLRKRK